MPSSRLAHPPRPPSGDRITRGFAPLYLLALCVAGCRSANAGVTDALERAGHAAGLVDPRPAQAPSIAIVCDLSDVRACTDGKVEEIVRRSAAAAFHHPGARVALWSAGPNVTDVTELAAVDVPTRTPRQREARVQEQRFVELAHSSLCPAIRPVLTVRRSTASPLVETIAKVVFAHTGDRPLRLVILSDAREVSRQGDFECGRLPNPAAWSAQLRRQGVLPADSLRGSSIHFVHVAGAAIRGRSCPVTVTRERAIRALWTTALSTAGATTVSFDAGLPDVEHLLFPNTPTRTRSL